jgi:uncharacterized membrane protein
MPWVTILFCHFCVGILSMILARKKHRSPLPWFFLTLPLGVLVIFLLLALPENQGSGVRGQGSEETQGQR